MPGAKSATTTIADQESRQTTKRYRCRKCGANVGDQTTLGDVWILTLNRGYDLLVQTLAGITVAVNSPVDWQSQKFLGASDVVLGDEVQLLGVEGVDNAAVLVVSGDDLVESQRILKCIRKNVTRPFEFLEARLLTPGLGMVGWISTLPHYWYTQLVCPILLYKLLQYTVYFVQVL